MRNQNTRFRNTVILLLVAVFLLCLLIIFFPRRSIEVQTGPTDEPSAGEKPSDEPATDIPAAEVRPSDEPAAGEPASGVRPSDEPAHLAIVIDDAGYNLSLLEPFLKFPAPLTVAVLPHLEYSSDAARRTLEAGKEVILHCPMEPIGDSDPGPGVIEDGLEAEEIRDLLDRAFTSVTEAGGMNNHMGSKVMQDPRVMDIIMEYLEEKGKFFLDSRTVSSSVAESAAEEHGVLHLSRSVFLDNDGSADAIRKQLIDGVELAKHQGYAILIGHVYNPAIITVLEEIYPTLEGQGVRVTFLSELL